MFVIADWVYPEAIAGNSGPLVYETKESYLQILRKTGFDNITFRDDSMIFLQYVEEFLSNIALRRGDIEQKYNGEVFSTILRDHQKLINDINQKLKVAVRIVAVKK